MSSSSDRRSFSLSVLAFVAAAFAIANFVACSPERANTGLTKVQAILQVSDCPSWSPLESSPERLPEFIRTQCELINSQFVTQAAVSRRDIASLPILRDKTNPRLWLTEALSVENPSDTSLIVITLAASGDSKELTQILDAVIDAYQMEVVAAERIAAVERRESSVVYFESLRKDYEQLYEQSQAIAKKSQDGGQSAAARLLKIKLAGLEGLLTDFEREKLSQEANDALRDMPVKVLQRAMSIEGN